MRVKFVLYQTRLGIGFLLAGLLLVIVACRLEAEPPVSNRSTTPSPVFTAVIAATHTPTLIPALSPIPTSTVVTIQQPTSTPTPSEVAIFPPPPTVTRIANAETDAERLKQIFSGGVSYIRLWPTIADMMLTDAQGRRLGYDPVSGQDVNEFFDNEKNFSSYFRHEGTEGNYKRIITLLPLQAWGSTITITITGIEAGEYTLLTTFSDGKNLDFTPMYVYTGTISPGKIVTKTIDIPKTIDAFPAPPKVEAGEDVSANVDQSITFAGSFTDINPDDTHQITWDFGDRNGARVTLTPNHTYITPGVYTVTLTVIDSLGFKITDTLQVTIN